MKQYEASCERNQGPILDVLIRVLGDCRRVLEIGSGTGQHAVHFGRYLPHLIWQTSDLEENHESIRAWIEEAGLENVLAPLLLDAGDAPWPLEPVDAIFSSNTLHILSWDQVQKFFVGVGAALRDGGYLCVYGAFNYAGGFTSESNAGFDAELKGQNPARGLRDFEAVDGLAGEQGLRLIDDLEMPRHNRLIVWQKREKFSGSRHSPKP